MKENFTHSIPIIAAELIEKKYYHDLNQAEGWDRLLETVLVDNGNFQENIERYASTGIQNIEKFIEYAREILKTFISIWFPTADQSEIDFINHYFNIICYLVQIKESVFLEKKSLDFNNLKNISNIMIDNHFLDLAQLSAESMVEMIVLPSLYENFSEFLSDLQHDSAAKILNEKFIELAKPDTISPVAFQWVHDLSVMKLIIPIINIFLIVKNNFFHCGTKKIYGYYQCLLDKQAGTVLYSIPYNTQMLLLRGSSALIAGVANIDNIEILANNILLIVFKNGLFLDDSANSRASLNAALAIEEHFSDCLFQSNDHYPLFPYQLVLETPQDNPHFSEEVLEQLCFLNPQYQHVVKIIPSLNSAPLLERNRYLMSKDIVLTDQFKDNIIQNMQIAGQKTNFTLTERAFMNVKLINLNKDDILVKEGDKALFIYIALTEGLEGKSSYQQSFLPKAWTPIGHIGVLQNLPRTATIIAKKPIELLMIPGIIYLSYWYMDYSEKELMAILTR